MQNKTTFHHQSYHANQNFHLSLKGSLPQEKQGSLPQAKQSVNDQQADARKALSWQG